MNSRKSTFFNLSRNGQSLLHLPLDPEPDSLSLSRPRSASIPGSQTAPKTITSSGPELGTPKKKSRFSRLTALIPSLISSPKSIDSAPSFHKPVFRKPVPSAQEPPPRPEREPQHLPFPPIPPPPLPPMVSPSLPPPTPMRRSITITELSPTSPGPSPSTIESISTGPTDLPTSSNGSSFDISLPPYNAPRPERSNSTQTSHTVINAGFNFDFEKLATFAVKSAAPEALPSRSDSIQNTELQAQPQAISGRKTPVSQMKPEIHLTETTPSPETRRKLMRPRSSSLHGLRVLEGAKGSGPRSSSVQPPPLRDSSSQQLTNIPNAHLRTDSSGAKILSQVLTPESAAHRGKVRRKSFFASRSRSNSHEIQQISGSDAWVISDGSGAEYSTQFLTNGDKVPELWNDSGTVAVHIYPRESERGASFKVPMAVVSSSEFFVRQMREQLSSNNSVRSESLAFDHDTPREYHIYVPGANTSESQSLDWLISVRNLFAFLTGQVLVATKSQPTLFAVFDTIANSLADFDFCSPDGETFGEIPNVSFSWYLSQTDIADVRYSREKTLEALVLAEQMRSKDLYHEAFAHTVGKYAALQATKSPLLDRLSNKSKSMIERANLELINRQHSLNNKLEQFDFPALFAGIASSNSAARDANFARWKTAFLRMRSFVLGYYRSHVGAWPPKASSKKNNFSESGLNRQVLKMLYTDLCALYDLLVDRRSLSPRAEGSLPVEPDPLDADPNSVSIHYLRKILDESDTSTPPVVPPIPFDIPLMPTMSTVYENYSSMSSKDQLTFDKKVAPHELRLVLSKAYNIDTLSLKLPFLDEFQEFEAKECKGLSGSKSLTEIVDQRIGYWLFLYSVIQALPILVVDAPDVKYAEGVEYFLCQPPMGSLPWIEDSSRKMWFEVAGGGVVELPPEAVKYSVQATYHRSHCWLSAKMWEEALNFDGTQNRHEKFQPDPASSHIAYHQPVGLRNSSYVDSSGTPSSRAGTPGSAGASPALMPHGARSSPTGSPQIGIHSRNPSPLPRGRTPNRANHAYRSSVALGIEPLALSDASFTGPSGRRHVSSTYDMPMPPELDSFSAHTARRSASHGNLTQLMTGIDSARSGSPLARFENYNTGRMHARDFSRATGSPSTTTDPVTEHTFDDILGKPEDKKRRKSKKWVLF